MLPAFRSHWPGAVSEDPQDTYRLPVSINVPVELAALNAALITIETMSNSYAKREQIAALESEADRPDLSDDPEAAHQISSELSRLHAEVRAVEQIRRKLDDAAALYNLAVADDDGDTHAAARREVIQLREQIKNLQARTMPSGNKPGAAR